MFKSLKNKKGFTLIELMIVVAILGILAAVAIPMYINYQYKARSAEVPVSIDAIKKGELSNLGASMAVVGAFPAKVADQYAALAIAPIGTVSKVKLSWIATDRAGYGGRVNWTPVGDASYGQYAADITTVAPGGVTIQAQTDIDGDLALHYYALSVGDTGYVATAPVYIAAAPTPTAQNTLMEGGGAY